MFELPDTKQKKPKPAYKKPDSVKELEQLANEAARVKYPNAPAGILAPRKYRDNTANGLTACIVAYITFRSGFASRISNQGTFNKKLGKYIPATSKKGLPDVLATYHGKSLFVEVKTGRDVMSIHQEKVQAAQEAGGGLYFLAHNFTDFKHWFDSL